MKNLLFLSVLFLAVTVRGQGDIAKVGQPIPKFTIYLDSGQQINSSTLNQKVILINFFALWCSPCLAELPLIQRYIWQKYRSNKDFSLLIIGRGYTYADMQTFKTHYWPNLPIYPDYRERIYSLFASQFIPRNYIIDKTGKIIYASTGFDRAEFFRMAAILDKSLK